MATDSRARCGSGIGKQALGRGLKSPPAVSGRAVGDVPPIPRFSHPPIQDPDGRGWASPQIGIALCAQPWYSTRMSLSQSRLTTATPDFADLIADIKKGAIKIPQFQRKFVWKEPQALRTFR